MLYKIRRRLLSQNFLSNRTLINLLVRRSSIGQNDIVLEIGSGKGFITTELLKIAKKVIAIELDEKLVLHLKRFLGSNQNLEVCQGDFMKFPLPRFPYKVFANIPFSIEGEIVRKLLNSDNPPDDTYLVAIRKLAFRLSGSPHENQFSLKHKPWFDFYICYRFKRSDFTPQPRADCVMWRITKKGNALLSVEERQRWERFIEIGFGQGTNVYRNLKRMMTVEQLNYLSGNLRFSLQTKPGYLSLNQWVQIYKIYSIAKN